MKTPHIAYFALSLLTLGLGATGVSGQSADAWREHFAAGQEARASESFDAYAREMARAADAMPEGLLNRPFVQYHAARGAALAGRPDQAIAWLDTAWREEIESLMISFAPYDPAFEELRDTEAFTELMGRAASMELGVRRLADDVYLIRGAGANLLAVVDGTEALLVDTGYAPALPALRDALASLGVGDVRQVIVTHAHEDHMGGTAELGAEATILAHPGTATAMTEPFVFMEGVALPPKPATALPDVQIARDTTIYFGSHRIRIVPTVAHTTGDLSVYLPTARVAHVGDTYLGGNPMMFPGTDDPDAFLDDVATLVAAMHPETIVIGGHDEPADLAAVGSQIETSRGAMAFVREAIDDGLTAPEAAVRAEGRFPPQWIAFFHRVFTDDGG